MKRFLGLGLVVGLCMITGSYTVQARSEIAVDLTTMSPEVRFERVKELYKISLNPAQLQVIKNKCKAAQSVVMQTYTNVDQFADQELRLHSDALSRLDGLQSKAGRQKSNEWGITGIRVIYAASIKELESAYSLQQVYLADLSRMNACATDPEGFVALLTAAREANIAVQQLRSKASEYLTTTVVTKVNGLRDKVN